MELHELKLMLQQHLTDGLVVIVGSGLSCAEGLPGMSDLATHLDKNLPNELVGPDLDCWNKISPLLPDHGLEAALLAIAPTPRVEAAIVARTVELVGSRERQVIAEIFSAKRKLRFTRLLNHLLKPGAGLPVVTTNYDRLVEIASEEAGLGVDTLFVGNFAGELNEAESRLSFCREVTLRGRSVQYRFRTRVNVYKPHGSLDWYHREGKPVRYLGDLDAPRLLITPGLNKFRNGYESPFDRHRERANQAIDKASRYLVIGYGFNDDHLETHLTPRIKAGVPALLLTRDLSENAKGLIAGCHNVIAVSRAVVGGVTGSTVYAAGAEYFFPGFGAWDLGDFVSEVFEP